MLPEVFAWNPFRLLLHEHISRIHVTPLTFMSRSLNRACKYYALSKCVQEVPIWVVLCNPKPAVGSTNFVGRIRILNVGVGLSEHTAV